MKKDQTSKSKNILIEKTMGLKTLTRNNAKSLNFSETQNDSKVFKKIDFYDDNANILWEKQLKRIRTENHFLTKNFENSSRENSKIFYGGDIFFKNERSLSKTTDSNIIRMPCEIKEKELSKDRVRDFHCERVLLSGKKDVQNAFQRSQKLLKGKDFL
jgi:hypothetical protein